MPSIPAYLADETYSTILSRMLASLAAAGLDTSEGSWARDMVAPSALMLAEFAANAKGLIARMVTSTSFGAYLDLIADEFGLTRLDPVKATGVVRFTAPAGTTIPAGARISTVGTTQAAAVVFTTNTSATVAGGGTYVDVAVTALTAGASGNVLANKVTLLGQSISGVTTVTNPAALTGGTDLETDEALRARIYQKARNPSAGGNKADYIQWATSVTGVGGVSVLACDDPGGPGAPETTVAIIKADKTPADSTLVAAVQAYIDSVRPAGADPVVVAATPVSINVAAALTIVSGYTGSSVRAQAQANIEAYLTSQAFAQSNDILYAKIANAIIDTPGVSDYTGLTVNTGTANISIGAQEVAVAGTITLT